MRTTKKKLDFVESGREGGFRHPVARVRSAAHVTPGASLSIARRRAQLPDDLSQMPVRHSFVPALRPHGSPARGRGANDEARFSWRDARNILSETKHSEPKSNSPFPAGRGAREDDRASIPHDGSSASPSGSSAGGANFSMHDGVASAEETGSSVSDSRSAVPGGGSSMSGFGSSGGHGGSSVPDAGSSAPPARSSMPDGGFRVLILGGRTAASDVFPASCAFPGPAPRSGSFYEGRNAL